ncbi:hypothetical protein ACA910_003731 [Epithemia clementina (nom. ined.)]
MVTSINQTQALASVSSSIALSRNLPESNSADWSRTGSVDTLRPIVRIREGLKVLRNQLGTTATAKCVHNISINRNKILEIPSKEQEFKQVFDAYSNPLSYKQRFLDQNVFLVYYTKGFYGPNCPNIEDGNASSLKQTMQYGACNEAWVAWESFLSELDFVQSQNMKDCDEDELERFLTTTMSAVDAYLEQAPAQDVKKAFLLLKGYSP